MGYIERAKIEDFFKEHCIIRSYDVDLLPDADVAPVRHGRWIAPLLMADGHIHAECSNCHKVRIIDNYCSACGAIMDLED